MRMSSNAAIAAFFLLVNISASAADSVPVGRLPRTVVPSHVALELKIDPAQTHFSGKVSMDVKVAEATRTIWMHGRDLTITQATITPKQGKRQVLTAALVDVPGVLRFTAPEPIMAGNARIEIDYSAPFGELQGAYRVKPEGIDYVVTQMEPTGARNTFPGFDEPSFKQPWDITLVIPADQQGVANTRQVKEESAGAGWKKLVFATTENLPSYLVAFAVGPWDIVEGPDLAPNTVREHSVKLRGIAAKGQGARMKYALDNTGTIVAAQEAYFGIAYPFDKLDLVAAPDFWAGAMENAGLIVYRDSLMFADEKSEVGRRQGYWGTHSHELAHQWFGDLVTMPWWDDLWLNEAFATWFGTKIVGQLQPGFHSDRGLMEGSFYAMAADSLASTRRVHEPIQEFTDIESAFDGITYQKGGAVLAMFERYVGEDKFRDAIRSYLRQHSRGNATSADLVNSIAAVSNDPDGVRKSFNDFIDQPGVPIIHVGAKCDGPTPALFIEQERFLPTGSAAPAVGNWLLPLCVFYGDTSGVHEKCGMVGGKQATVALKTDSCPTWVMPNANGAGYYRFAMSPADQARLEANFTQLNEREQRSFADSISAAYSAGALDSRSFLSAAARLANSPVRQTATAPLRRIDWMIERLAKTEAEKQGLRDYAAKLYAPRLAELGMEAKDGESDDDRLLRSALIGAMVDTARDPALRAELAAKGRAVLGLAALNASAPGDRQLHLEAAPIDQRGLALRMAMQHGDATVFDALLKHFATSQDPVVRSQLLGAAGDARQPELAERARVMVLKAGAVRRNEIRLLLGSNDDPMAQKVAREWLDANFSAIEARISPNGAGLVSAYTVGMCSTEEAATVLPKFAQRMSTIEGGPRALAQAVEGVNLCASLKAKQGTATLPPL